jgi:ribosomal protein L4
MLLVVPSDRSSLILVLVLDEATTNVSGPRQLTTASHEPGATKQGCRAGRARYERWSGSAVSAAAGGGGAH